jgi:hypothetical protein
MYSLQSYTAIPQGLEWDSFLIENEGGYFQSADYFFHSKELPNHFPLLILIKNNDVILCSLLAVLIVSGKGLRGYFSKRLIVIGGPVVSSVNPNRNKLTLDILRELIMLTKHKSRYVEFRNLFNLNNLKQEFTALGFVFSDHLNYQVDIQNELAVKSRISKSKLRQINASLKAGAFIEEAKSEEDVYTLYAMLKELYKTKVRKPLPEFEFFKILFHHSQFSDKLKIFIVKYEKEIVGGIISPVFNLTIYEWYVCGRDGVKKNIYPSVLATWAAIQYGFTHNLKVFDFLGAGSPDQDYGVREFKARFGGTLVNHGRFLRINNRFLYLLGKIGFSILSKTRKI